MRSATVGLVVLLCALGGARAARADGGAKAIAAELSAAKDQASRKKAVDALVALDPSPVAELAELLARSRASSDADRRALLKASGFDVPDEKGKFTNPNRQTDKEEKANDQLDWLAPLLDDPAGPPVSDVLVDLAVIRALAATKGTEGADAILTFAFAPDGIAYRDECGRFLRKMSPWSLPALIMGAESRAKGDAAKSRARYAKYQLERLDRENPKKALNDAPTDALKVLVLKAFAESQYREAVFAVLDTVDDVSPLVRRAAREAWIEYATGRPPVPPPKQKLQLPGGKLADKETPLWMDHRELADIAIRRRLEQLTGTAPAGSAKLGDLSAQLFQFYDTRRAQELEKELDAALEEGRGGKLAEAGAVFDRILVQAPDFARRPDMADVYLKLGESLDKDGKHREAAAAFGKAVSVAPEGPVAGKALAAQHRARGQALEAEGKDGAAELARASEIDSSVAAAAGGEKSWMLYVGVGGGVAGLLLLVWGLATRRRHWR